MWSKYEHDILKRLIESCWDFSIRRLEECTTNISHDDDSLRNFIHQLEENAVTQPSLIRLIEENRAGRIRPSNCRGRFNEWKYVKRIIQGFSKML